MEINEVTFDFYKSIFKNTIHRFNSSEFNVLNSSKCENVYYLVFKDSKVRLGIILGVRDNVLNSPFSSSFGGFEACRNDIKIHQIDESLDLLKKWSLENEFNGIRIIQAPVFYDNNFSVKLSNCLYRAGFNLKNSEINYHFDTSQFGDNYLNLIWPNARNKLNQSFTNSLTFNKISADKGKLAYDIIKRNREERGFPLRLSYDQIKETETVIPIDYFLVSDNDQIVASALVFHLSTNIVRVVYWGDLPEFSNYKTMNFLSYNIFKYYTEIGIDFIDIGHSTVDSIPNHGLCEFKESIGCNLSILNEYYLTNL